MTGFKWGIIAGTAAFLISLSLGFIAHNQVLRVFITASIFGFIFLGIGIGLKTIFENFFPDILIAYSQEENIGSFEEENEPASNLAAPSGEFPVPDMYKIPGKTLELGNIEDLISGNFVPVQEGVDQNQKIGYNSLDSLQDDNVPDSTYEADDFSLNDLPQDNASSEILPNFSPSFGEDEGLGGLPELDSFAMIFSPETSGGQSAGASSSLSSDDSDYMDFFSGVPPKEPEPDRSKYKGNKPAKMEGNFDAKTMAEGIRTTLNKDK